LKALKQLADFYFLLLGPPALFHCGI